MSYCKCNIFERKLAYHTAPALLGIKPSNLFSIYEKETGNEEIDDFNKKTECRNLKLKVICRCQERMLIMIYNQQKLDVCLHRTENITLLRKYGYNEDMTMEKMLERLSSRIEQGSSFPHEIGVFLGYPIEDVCGFIENGGGNFKLSGYWKVYGNAEEAKRMFTNYDKCRSFLCNKLSQGTDIYQALKISVNT